MRTNLPLIITAPLAALLLLTSCTSTVHATAPNTHDGVVDVVATTGIIADLASHVAGNRARVTSMMPAGTDPHTFEPSLRSVRNIANADVLLTHGLLLEQNSLLSTVDNVHRPHVPVIAVAEEAPRNNAQLIPLVENIVLDTVWLGLRIADTRPANNTAVDAAADTAAQTNANSPIAKTNAGTQLRLTNMHGPGPMAAYITSTFGVPEVLFNTSDGITDADHITLPADAHTHVSWAFSTPGAYTLTFEATAPDGTTLGATPITIVVGTDPHSSSAIPQPTVVDSGHIDITADLDQHRITLRGDAPDSADTHYDYDPLRTVIAVPAKVLQQIPADRQFRFLGAPGSEVYLLPQAVLGKHVHGEVDPHVWHSIPNAIAMVRTIQDALISVDPGGRAEYTANTERYVAELAELDAWLREQIEDIPPSNRHLVTTHDGYAYLGKEYGMNIAGFVAPNPAVEPSPRDIIALTRTLENLHIPAVFLEPQLAGRAGVLTETAGRLDIQVCTIRGDVLDAQAPTYVDMMRSNAAELRRCLGD